MIHTILPPEIIMESEPSRTENTRYVPIQNGFVRTVRDPFGQTMIESLFSTDPYDYLDAQYQPGRTF